MKEELRTVSLGLAFGRAEGEAEVRAPRFPDVMGCGGVTAPLLPAPTARLWRGEAPGRRQRRGGGVSRGCWPLWLSDVMGLTCTDGSPVL